MDQGHKNQVNADELMLNDLNNKMYLCIHSTN